MTKLQFKSTDCKVFRHRFTPKGLKANEDKIEAIVQMQVPKTKTELKSFLGMVNYLGRYTAALAELWPPLDRLYKKDTVWRWDPQHQWAFYAIKTVSISLPVLVYFDPNKEHIIQCDASKKRLGAVLLQEGQLAVYILRSLRLTKDTHSARITSSSLCTRKTKLPNIWTQKKSTDWSGTFNKHMEETSIINQCKSSKRLLFRLLKYDIDLQYPPWKKYVIADALSRVSLLAPKDTDVKSVNCIAFNELAINIPATTKRLQEFQDSAWKDNTLTRLAESVHKGWPNKAKDCPSNLQEYWAYRGCISLVNGLLFKDYRLIIPQSEWMRKDLRVATLWTLWYNLHKRMSKRNCILARN